LEYKNILRRYLGLKIRKIFPVVYPTPRKTTSSVVSHTGKTIKLNFNTCEKINFSEKSILPMNQYSRWSSLKKNWWEKSRGTFSLKRESA
jgi:hypothetical protein